MPEKSDELMDAMFRVKHLLDIAKRPVPPESLGHMTRSLMDDIEKVLKFCCNKHKLEAEEQK